MTIEKLDQHSRAGSLGANDYKLTHPISPASALAAERFHGIESDSYFFLPCSEKYSQLFSKIKIGEKRQIVNFYHSDQNNE